MTGRRGLTAGLAAVLAVAAITTAAAPAVAQDGSAVPGGSDHATLLAATAPGAPVVMSVSATGLGALVAWQPASATDQVSNYSVAASAVAVSGVTVPAGCQAPPALVVSASNSGGLLGGLCAQVAYRVTVRAFNDTVAGPASDPSNIVVPLPAQPPAQPLVTGVVSRDRQLIVNWVAPSDAGGSPITGLQVRATSPTGAVVASATVAADATATTLSGLVNNTQYAVAVVATNGVGASPPGSATGTPQRRPKPGAPGGLTVTPAQPGELAVSWTPPADDGGKPVKQYAVTTRVMTALTNPDGTTGYVAAKGSRSKTVKTKNTNVTLKKLTPTGVLYQVSVQAVTAFGNGAEAKNNTPIEATTTVADKTVVLSAETLAALRSWDGRTLTWADPTPAQVAGIQTGAVLVAGVSPRTPAGLLVTVTAVDHPSAGATTITTGPARLSDAFSDLDLSAVLDPARTARAEFRPATAGIQQIPTPVPANAGVTLNSGITLGLSQNFGPVKVAGNVSLNATFGLEAKIDAKPWDPRAQLGAYAQLTASADVSVTASKSYSGRWKLGSINLGPVDIQAGPIPIILVPKIDIFATADAGGTVKVGFSTGATFGAGVGWDSDHPGRIATRDLSETPTLRQSLTPKFSARLTASVGLLAEADVLIYGVSGPTVHASVKLRATLDPLATSPDPWFSLDIVVGADVGWTIDVLVWSNSVTATLVEKSWNIYKATSSTPIADGMISIAPTDVAVMPGTSRQFTVTDRSGQPVNVIWKLVGGVAGDVLGPTGVFTPVGPAGRTVTINADDGNGRSDYVEVTVGAGPFDPPTELTAGYTDRQSTAVNVTWRPPTRTGGSPVSGYRVFTTPSTSTVTVSAQTTNATITGLDPAVGYVISVTATNTAGNQSPAATTRICDPEACLAHQWAWVRQLGVADEVTEAWDVAVDRAGNVIIVGSTTGQLPGAPEPNQGHSEAFVTKYDRNGNRLWTRQSFTERFNDVASAVAVDDAGNIIVTSTDHSSEADSLVTKYDANGTRLWTRQTGSRNSEGSLSDVAVDAAGNIIVTGTTEGQMPGAPEPNQGYNDVFVAKYDPNGNRLWIHQTGSALLDGPGRVNSEGGSGVAVDAVGNIVITGCTSGQMPGAPELNQGTDDTFVMKYDPNGNRLWTHQTGSAQRACPYGVAVDAAGDIVIAGSTDGQMPGAPEPNPGRGTDVFVVRYDPNGNRLWTHQTGSTSYDYVHGVAVDAAGNILIAGTAGGQMPGAPELLVYRDAYIAKYDPNGTRRWTHQIGSTSSDDALGVTVDAAGNVFIAGVTTGQMPGAPEPNQGHSDAFVAKY